MSDEIVIRRYDLRHEQTNPPKTKTKKHRVRSDGTVVERRLSSIDAVVLHQTATPFSASSASVAKAGGDEDLALARRALGVACHAMAFRRGFYVLPCPLSWYVYHGNGFNSRSLGLEVEGLYAGIEGDPKTIPGKDDPNELDERTIASARAALRALVEEGRALGCPIRYVLAHRQSSKTRRADPGSAIWREVGLWSVGALGLEVQSGLVEGDGRPIPEAWDPTCVGARY